MILDLTPEAEIHFVDVQYNIDLATRCYNMHTARACVPLIMHAEELRIF